MSRGRSRKAEGKSIQIPENKKTTAEKSSECSSDEHAAMNSLQANISAVHAEIKAIRSDMKADLHSFHDSFAREMKSQL